MSSRYYGHAIPRRELKVPNLSPEHIKAMRKYHGLDVPLVTEAQKRAIPSLCGDTYEYRKFIDRQKKIIREERKREERNRGRVEREDFLDEWRKKYSAKSKTNQRLKAMGVNRWWEQ